MEVVLSSIQHDLARAERSIKVPGNPRQRIGFLIGQIIAVQGTYLWYGLRKECLELFVGDALLPEVPLVDPLELVRRRDDLRIELRLQDPCPFRVMHPRFEKALNLLALFDIPRYDIPGTLNPLHEFLAFPERIRSRDAHVVKAILDHGKRVVERDVRILLQRLEQGGRRPEPISRVGIPRLSIPKLLSSGSPQ